MDWNFHRICWNGLIKNTKSLVTISIGSVIFPWHDYWQELNTCIHPNSLHSIYQLLMWWYNLWQRSQLLAHDKDQLIDVLLFFHFTDPSVALNVFSTTVTDIRFFILSILSFILPIKSSALHWRTPKCLQSVWFAFRVSRTYMYCCMIVLLMLWTAQIA